MAFLLNIHNIFDYLIQHGYCNPSEQNLCKLELVPAKNFNVLVTFPDNHKLLVKQEPHNQEGKAAGEFLREWRIQEFLQHHSQLNYISSSFPEGLYFDSDNSIIIFRYLDNYHDLMQFYAKQNIFNTEIASVLGKLLGSIHQTTVNNQEYENFFSQTQDNFRGGIVKKLTKSLERIGPEIFGTAPPDGLKFFALYQRYDSLGQAIAELNAAYKPICLTHNDLKLNNILLHKDWQELVNQSHQENLNKDDSVVRIIDWERVNWGDPAFDVGTLISCYLQIWLNSLIVNKAVTIEESLRLATIPLEIIQPSIAAFTSTYLENFPEIFDYYPDFIKRVIQFSGLGLVQAIQSVIQYQKSFGNSGICMLQVAKSLLCRPEQSIPTIFGTTEIKFPTLSNNI
jgi:serine/threonine protein kinase